MHEDELLDLVNADDKVIGTILRSQYDKMVKESLGFIRAVEVFIQNDKGQLWVPRRTADKRIAPNGLDYSTGGHVSSGETYMQSCLREIKEELNLDLKPEDLHFVKKYGPDERHYLREFYTYRSNQIPDYNKNDFTEYFWLTPQELFDKLETGEPAKSSLKETVTDLLKINAIK